MQNVQINDEQRKRLAAFLKSQREHNGWTHDVFLAELNDGADKKSRVSTSTLQRMTSKGTYSVDKMSRTFLTLGVSEDHPMYREFVLLEKSVVPVWQRKSAIAAVVAMVLALSSFLLFFDEMKTLISSDEERALKELSVRGVSLTSSSIESMVKSGDIGLLELASKAGLQTDQIESALARAGEDFFRATRRKANAIAWLESQFQGGLNPELRVDSKFYKQTSLFYAALAAENVPMALSVLNAGGSPHPYQDIHGLRQSSHAFLSPLRAVARFDRFSESEKKQLLSLMLEKGAIYYELIETSTSKTPTQTGDDTVIDLQEVFPTISRFVDAKPRRVELKTTAFERDRMRCEIASRLDDRDWCLAMDEVPTLILVTDQSISDIHRIYVQDLINVSNGSAYFYVTQLDGYKSIYGILELTPDTSRYNLSLYGSRNGQGKGLCQGDKARAYEGRCWQRWTIEKISKSKATVNGYYEAEFHYPKTQ